MAIESLSRIGALAVATLAAMAIAASAVAGQIDQTSRLTGSARITGRVIAADDGKPVRHAEVHLSGRPDAEPDNIRLTRTFETDLNGRFQFVDLPPGVYAIFLSRLTGFIAPGRQEARLADRQAVDLTIRAPRTGAIEGRILDQYGDAVLGAQVVAVERVDVAGYHTWGTRRESAQTNDRGEFRIFNLAEGDYYLLALKTLLGGPHQPPPPPVGYVLTYYPGSTKRVDSRAVTVRAGRDTKAQPFELYRRRLATVTVPSVDSRGAALGSEASAYLRRLNVPDTFSSGRWARLDGSEFVFRGVEPGDYSLVVSTSSRLEESAYRAIAINEADVRMEVQTTTGARVSGRVIVDGRPAEGGPGLPNVWVSAQTPPNTLGVAYGAQPNVHLRGTDRFELTGLRGPMQLSGDVTYGKLVSIRRGSEELSWKVIDFAGTEALDDVVVELTTHVARLELTLPGSSDADSREPLLLIFPEDRQRWRPGLAFQSSGWRGAAEFRLLPGRYLVVALISGGFMDPTDPALLEKLAPLATRVNLAAGETTKLTLPLANARR